MSFDPYALGQDIATEMIEKLGGLNLPPEDLDENAAILREFNQIAAQMLTEQGIQIPAADGSASNIPLDERITHQAMILFSEGLYFAMIKCAEMGITGDVKKHLLQNLAMNVYEQSTQIVASTYGQEHTPDFQFTHEQQVQFICQGAESALMYYINEYEREFGPIEVEEPSPEIVSKVEKTLVEEGIIPAPEGLPVAQAPMPSAKPKGPTPHDKYGAVALLLTTLPADQRGRILNNFNHEEKELIGFYSYPQHIEQNLDISCVQAHLKRFKEQVKQGGPGLRSSAYRGIARLAKNYPVEKLLSYVKDERPLVKQYLESHYGGNHPPEGLSGMPAKNAENRHFSESLPGRIEEILYRYLSKRMEPVA